MEILNLKVNAKNTDRCSDCPGRNDEEGCMWWWEWVEMNSSGQERLKKQCGKQAMQVFMVEVIKASNRPAAAVESTRNEIVRGFGHLAEIMASKPAEEPKKVPVGFIRKMLGR